MPFRHYDPKEVLGWVGDCLHFECISNEQARRFRDLVEQANAAFETQRRYERALALVLECTIVLAEKVD